MIDYYLKYTDEAAAQAALASRLNSDGSWPLQYCIPNIRISRISTGLPIAGFFILVSLNTVVPAVRDFPAVQVVLDREMAKARQPGSVIKSNITNALLQDLMISPVFMGADIPYGNIT